MQGMQEIWVQSLGRDGMVCQEGMTTHSSILTWRILWTEKPGGLQSMGLQRVRHDWSCTHIHAVWAYKLTVSQLWTKQLDVHTLFFFLIYFWLEDNCFTRCVGFCHTTTWISCKYTNIHSLLNLPSTPTPSHPARLRIPFNPGISFYISTHTCVKCLTYLVKLYQ